MTNYVSHKSAKNVKRYLSGVFIKPPFFWLNKSFKVFNVAYVNMCIQLLNVLKMDQNELKLKIFLIKGDLNSR